jgi:hypothetical protein
MTRGTTTTSLAVIGASALVHLKVPQTVGAFVRAKAQGTDFVVPEGGPTIGKFAAWAGGFAALSMVMVASEGSPDLGPPMSALAVLIATTGVIAAWDDWVTLLHITPVTTSPAQAHATAEAVGQLGASAGAAYLQQQQPTASASWSAGTTVPNVPQTGSVV